MERMENDQKHEIIMTKDGEGEDEMEGVQSHYSTT